MRRLVGTMRVLVTGGAGFVGANVTTELLRRGCEVIVAERGAIDAGTARRLRAAAGDLGRLHVVPCDVTQAGEIARVCDETRPDLIVHLAALTPDASTERDTPASIVETNELGTLRVLGAGAACGVRRVVFVSSAAVYEPGDGGPLDEAMPLHDGTEGGLYALTKIAGERLCRWARRVHGLDVRIVRLGPVYGPFERPTGAREGMSAVRRALTLALAGEPICCNAPGVAQDWVYGPDAAQAIAAVLLAPELPGDCYNVAGATFATMEQLLDTVRRLVPGCRVVWVPLEGEANLPLATGMRRRGPLDYGRIGREVRWSPAHDLDAGIGAYLDWLRAGDNPEGTR